ncbi:MAG: cob(I)yrinic acid a,c-diamide adenosyltransferase [Candidatus Liptonbacteria bacterium]|nr:cob(I)yrinic acid a,c-diamide adenosyltransferase [Candidatus Liptonbacteria bacterium]
MRTPFFTGQGDSGSANLGNRQVPKDDLLFEVLGGLDGLNSWLGLVTTEAERTALPQDPAAIQVGEAIRQVQETLFVAQAEIAAIGTGREPAARITHAHVARLEEIIFAIDAVVPPLTKFVIPGGSELAARLDVARTVVRELERRAVSFHRQTLLSPDLLAYLNRLSSFFFTLARYVNLVLQKPEAHPSYE